MEGYKLIKNTSEIYYNGSKWTTNNCGTVTIIGKLNKYYLDKKGYKHYNYYLCKFDDGTIVETEYKTFKNGKIKNPNYPSVYNVGYLGEGQWNSGTSNKHTKEYEIWKKMLQRCYDKRYYEKQPTYKEVIVDERWFNFQNFCEDIQELKGYKDWKNNRNFELDKDILCNKMNIDPKIYSKDTCLFISKKENNSNKNKNYHLTGKTFIGIRLSDGYEEEFVNQPEFAKKWGLTFIGVNSAINGKQKKHKDWIFKIKKEEENN